MAKVISPDDLERARNECLERERKREWKRRHTLQGAFEAEFSSYDAIIAEDKHCYLSDGGRGAALSRRFNFTEIYEKKVRAARMKADRNCPKCRDVLNAILQYGTNKAIIVCALLIDEFVKKYSLDKNCKKILRDTFLRDGKPSESNTTENEKHSANSGDSTSRKP